MSNLLVNTANTLGVVSPGLIRFMVTNTKLCELVFTFRQYISLLVAAAS